MTAFNWQIVAGDSGEAEPQVQLSRPYGPWLTLGDVAQVLEDYDTPREFAWRSAKADPDLLALFLNAGIVSKYAQDLLPPEHPDWIDPETFPHLLLDWDSFPREADALWRRRAREDSANSSVCSQWLTAFGLRVKDTSKWRALSLGCWVKTDKGECFVTGVFPEGVALNGVFHEWNEIAEWPHSTDRKTWKPCTITEETK